MNNFPKLLIKIKILTNQQLIHPHFLPSILNIEKLNYENVNINKKLIYETQHKILKFTRDKKIALQI